MPAAIAVSLVSLAGGASLGPEDALGKMGGGLGTWVSERQKLSEDVRATNTLSGMSAAYGGLLSSPILASILTLEIARPKAARFADALVAGLLASTVAFAVYFPIAGSTFVGLYALPSYTYEDWQLLAAVPLGLVAGALALITAVAIGVMAKLTAPLAKFTVLRPLIGGVAFGLVGVALPLTLFTGTDQLTTVIHDGAALGAGLLIAVVFAKILVFALCEATGFIGGPFLVMLFIGGTAGMTAHVLIPGLPAGLAFTAMFAALPGSLVAAPFSLLLLGALTTQIGTLQMAPVTVAVLTRISPCPDPACSCRWRASGASPQLRRADSWSASRVLGEQNADCVEDEERGEDQECVEGDLRLSATDFALRALHERDDAFAEEQEQDQRAPDERGRERDVDSDKRRLVSVSEACSDDRRRGQAGQYKPLRATDPEQESGDDSREDAQPAESFDQRLRPRLRAFVRGCAVFVFGGLRWTTRARAISTTASATSSAARRSGWLALEPVTAMPKITSTEHVRICAPTKPAPKPSAFSRPDGITASVAANPTALRPAKRP